MDLPEIIEFFPVIKLANYFVTVEWLRPLRLPDKIRRYGIFGAVCCIGQRNGTPKCAVVVVSHPRPGSYDQRQRYSGPAKQHRRSWPILSKEHPARQKATYGQAKKHAIIAPASAKKYDTRRHQQSVAEPCLLHESRNCTEHKRSAKGRARTAARVGIDPRAEY